jgi:serralysin
MAYRTYAGKLQKTDDGLTLVVAGSSDSVLFTRTAYYAALGDGAHVLTYKRSITLGVDGQLISTNGSTVMGGGSIGSSDIRIGATGSVIANGGTAFEITASDLTFTNHGEVSGVTGLIAAMSDAAVTNTGTIGGRTAIDLTGQGATVVNTGTIIGTVSGIHIDGGVGAQHVTNTGLVTGGRSVAIDVNAGGDVLITNSGTITGRTGINLDVKDGGAAADRMVVNTGTISGTFYAVFGSAQAETIRNEGLISGTVNLFAGNDDYDGSLGSISGWVLGDAGLDTVTGGAGRDRFDGGSGDDILTGGDGADLLIGGDGADFLDGGAGRDIASYRNYAAGVFLLGEGAEMGDGTDTFVSIEGLEGTGGDDTLIGTSGDNWLYGGDGNDTLLGEGGRDVLVGGAGDDLYDVFGSDGFVLDRIIEQAGGGIDTVRAYANCILPDNVEKLIIGSANAYGFGNTLANTITGSIGDNLINGREGSDTLTGGGGNDRFQFTTALGPGNIDTITDFRSNLNSGGGADRILLSSGIFGALPVSGVGNLNPSAFSSAGTAQDADDRIILNVATGALYFDPDGTGAAAQILFAIVKGDNPTAADIYLI